MICLPDAVKITAPAKVNLFLEVLGKRSDGFHELETIMTTTTLADELFFNLTDDGKITLEVEPAEDDLNGRNSAVDTLPTDDANLIVRALALLKKNARQDALQTGDPLSQQNADPRKFDAGMHVKLKKRIPSAAGLGGASSNAAAAIVAGNALWNLGFDQNQLHDAAAAIGSDVPFFLYGDTAICTGRGEQIHPITLACPIHFVVVKPSVGLSTPSVFKACSVAESPKSSAAMVAALAGGDPDPIAAALHNRLQSTAEGLVDEIGQLALAFDKTECLGHQMSGSGTSYFGVFQDSQSAGTAALNLKEHNSAWDVFCVQSL